MGMVQGWGVISAVTCYRYHLTMLLKHGNKALLVGRTSPAHHLQAVYTLISLIVSHCRKVRTQHDSIVVTLALPYSYLPGYLLCCGGSVACNDLHVYSCLPTFLYSSRHILSDRV